MNSPKRPETLHQLRAINRTLLIERHRRRRSHSALGNLANVAALGITVQPRNGPKRPRFNCIGLPHKLANSGSALLRRRLWRRAALRAIRPAGGFSIARRARS
jgi:hypothetical protein